GSQNDLRSFMPQVPGPISGVAVEDVAAASEDLACAEGRPAGGLLYARARPRAAGAERFHASERTDGDDRRAGLQASVLSLHVGLLELGMGHGVCFRIMGELV